jgi:4-hydroxybenzoate polyprenyltransferase
MIAFLRLIRWQNLLIVILTMVLLRYAVIEPLLSKITVKLVTGPIADLPLELRMPWYDFVILVLSTVLITAGGYVINDYFDIRTDLINKGKVIVGNTIPRRKAMMWHNIFNAAGVAGGFYVSWRSGYFWLGTIFLIVSGLLYFYSASYKRQFLIGNLIVALLTAMVPLMVAVYEWPALYSFYSALTLKVPDFGIIMWWAGGFALFAFLTTLTREVIKDIEDFEGDLAYGRHTLPVVTGIFASKLITAALAIITIALLYLVWFRYINDIVTLVYVSALLAAPMLFVVFLLFRSHEKRQLHLASRTMKIVMLNGILYSLIVKAILDWNLYGLWN